MKRIHTYIILFTVGILGLVSCKDDHPKKPYVEPEHYSSVAILYYIADNSLSYPDEDFAGADLQELEDGRKNIPQDCKVIVYADRIDKAPAIYTLDAHNGLKLWKELPEEDCTDSLTMLNNLRSITRAFPADKYGLTFGAHGSGWIVKKRKSIGWDQSHRSNEMNIPTLRGVLEQLPHLEYIFFDVCFMQSIEVAYELRNVTDWIVASPAEIPGPGAPYHLICGAMSKGDALGILKGYDSYYPVTYKRAYYPGVILSAIKTSELEALAKATNTALSKVYSGRNAPRIGDNVQKYSTEYSSFTYCYDMNSLMFNVLPDGYADWNDALDKAIPKELRIMNSGSWTAEFCSKHYIYDKEHFSGISMFVPENTTESMKFITSLRQFQWYKAVGWDENGW